MLHYENAYSRNFEIKWYQLVLWQLKKKVYVIISKLCCLSLYIYISTIKKKHVYNTEKRVEGVKNNRTEQNRTENKMKKRFDSI